MISFIPRIGKVQTGQTSGRFTVIIPKNKIKISYYNLILKSQRFESYVRKRKLVSFNFQDCRELGRENFMTLVLV